ncbi:hypothetical protein B0H10DRAFT_2079058 [Mycena sp. CBHHK59/15]|nr:hypothetical protein B0H10DRAFT_2079058 [Mycena sp. CBHHK59/15]
MNKKEEERGLTFVIVGASIAGLSSAIALKASGHDVLVLEKETQLGGPDSIPNGGVRLAPNGCKVLFDWGLEAEIKAKSVIGAGFTLYKYDHGGNESGRDFLGTNIWDPQLPIEARGDFLQMRHKDLLRILCDTAIKEPTGIPEGHSPTVRVLFGSEVTDVNLDACSVTLRSGEVHTGDVVVGADGACGLIRSRLITEENGRADIPTGLAVYSAVIPKAVAVKDKELAKLYESPLRNMATISLGPNRGAKVFLVGEDDSEDVSFCVYTLDSPQNGTWTQEAERKMSEIVGRCDNQLQRLAALAGPSTCVQMKDYYELESWVSQSGKVLALGEAAHPFPTISLHTYSVAIEDGAFLGTIFSRTRSSERIREFLHAFELQRKPRCTYINHSEKQYLETLTLPDGPLQEERDATMRANEAAGRNVMDAPEADLQQIWESMRKVFGYEPADDADEWWMAWGRLRDASTGKVDHVARRLTVTKSTDGSVVGSQRSY